MNTNDLKLGDLILVRGEGLISEAIEHVEGGPYSHTAGYVGNDELIEAEGFRKTGYTLTCAYKGHADVFRCDSMTDEQEGKILLSAVRSVGGHYDYALLIVELIRYWFGVLMPYREPPNSRICSTLWAVGCYRKAGIDLCPGIRFPSPGDLSASKLLRKVGSL